LTAGAVVLGAVVILFDPIFQGLAISLMGGTITSTFLTLLVVPLLYWRMLRRKYPLVKEPIAAAEVLQPAVPAEKGQIKQEL
ncbi:MAG TPA: hypothetical protein VF145_10170, partial [Chitinophagaceae bacterium]